jgi:hypothetical protein
VVPAKCKLGLVQVEKEKKIKKRSKVGAVFGGEVIEKKLYWAGRVNWRWILKIPEVCSWGQPEMLHAPLGWGRSRRLCNTPNQTDQYK